MTVIWSNFYVLKLQLYYLRKKKNWIQLNLNLFQYLSLHGLFHLVHDKLHDEAKMCTLQGQEEPEITWWTTFSWPFCEEHRLSCTRNPNLFRPGYWWQGEISVCKVLVLIKVVSVKNDYFLHPKFELHRYFGFLYWRSFYWKNDAYISHELIVRLIPTWIWYNLLTVSQIWPLNHQLSYYF